jgi:hypothetical protein
MSVTVRLLAAYLLCAALASGAPAQEKPSGPAPAPAGAAHDPSVDLEPSVNTSASANEADAHPTRTPQAPAAPARAAKPAGQSPAGADGKPKANAKDRIELDTTQITGNRELPKVLYIVPWKHSDLSDLGGRPANSLLDEVLAPVDRDVFQRENRYYGALHPDEPHAGRAPGTPPAPAAATAAPRAQDER